MDTANRRSTLAELLRSALAAVSPERLTREALRPLDSGPATIVAIGKASAAMCRGASQVVEVADGICVTGHSDRVPRGIDLLVGDHPIPSERSFAAGSRVLQAVAGARGPVIVLISGGGSALCEHPIEGVSPEFIRTVDEDLLALGAPIADVNLVRRHLSEIKNGGLARHAGVPVSTYLISDVSGADLALVASGPTIHRPREPGRAIAAMRRMGIGVPEEIEQAIRRYPDIAPPDGPIRLLADGHTAAAGLVDVATSRGLPACRMDGWLEGDVREALDDFFDAARPGVMVAAGEPDVAVAGDGLGGRSTHAALLAAERIAGTEAVFAAFATDGIDGNSSSAGAIVDGSTTERGGDAGPSLASSDSATYLTRSGDLIVTGPTGTNVSDLWVLWT